MRFDTPVYFQLVKQGRYDVSTGNYGEYIIEETKRCADVTDAGAEILNLIYGEVKQGAVVIRLQNHYDKPFDRIRIGGKVFRADFRRELRHKHVFIASEVQ